MTERGGEPFSKPFPPSSRGKETSKRKLIVARCRLKREVPKQLYSSFVPLHGEFTLGAKGPSRAALTNRSPRKHESTGAYNFSAPATTGKGVLDMAGTTRHHPPLSATSKTSLTSG